MKKYIATLIAGVALIGACKDSTGVPDFNNPSIPHVDLEVDPGVIRIRCTNPPPDGENPVTIENQIARKESDADDASYVVVGTCPPDGVFADWTVASGTSYTYKARGRS